MASIAKSEAAEATLSTFRRLGIDIHMAALLEELAGKIVVPADALARTAEGPTYHAIHPLTPEVILTFGGIITRPRGCRSPTAGRSPASKPRRRGRER